MKTSERTVLKGYYWNHDAIRKDVSRLQNVAERVESLNRDDYSKISRWYDHHKFALTEHHHAEDNFFFPMISERTKDFENELKQFDQEHHQLDEQMEKMESLLNKLANDDGVDQDKMELINAIREYNQLVINHLDKEEKIVEQTTTTHFTPVEILEKEAEFRTSMPQDKMARLMPWMVDAMDDKDRKFFFSMLPFVPRLLYKWRLKKQYEKMTEF